jgi:UDP-N-acetylmuramoyl-tripeptide--D-alanyl-D-alanine ligase
LKLTIERICEILSARGSVGPENSAQKKTVQGYSIDSRTVRPGDLFFAVKGERLDGHDFVEQALANGAVTAVVRKDHSSRFPDSRLLIPVADTLSALQTLAAEVRHLWGKTVIGVTGSAGKTTTKEAIAHLLAGRFRVLKSEGNLNNQFGLPLMVLRLEPEHEIAVIEMGMSHAGEITELARIAQPEIGVVTCVAPVHLEYFTSLSEIAKAKQELIHSLPKAGIAVLNADDEYVAHFGRDFHGKVITFGIRNPAGVRAENIASDQGMGSTFGVSTALGREAATLPLVGVHNIYNALAAVAVALECGMSLSDSVARLATLVPAEKRGQVILLAGATVINDCYNSNPKALDSMVDALSAMPAQRRIVVAGEMLELGTAAADMHRQSGAHMAERGIDMLVGVRGEAKFMVEAANAGGVNAKFVSSPEEAGEWLAREVRPGDAVLLKASRGVRLERALERWTAKISSHSTSGTDQPGPIEAAAGRN